MSPVVGRTLTIVAIAILAFDGAALVALGFMTGRMVLVPIGLVFFLSSGLIVLYWRWHRRRLDDISETRRALADEAREMRRLLGKK
jgi:uncharacterized integral membrane protein